MTEVPCYNLYGRNLQLTWLEGFLNRACVHTQCHALQWLSVFFLLGEFIGFTGTDSKETNFDSW